LGFEAKEEVSLYNFWCAELKLKKFTKLW
jgi:hypothetical protein